MPVWNEVSRSFPPYDSFTKLDPSCKNTHDLSKYLLAKPRDIYWPVQIPPINTTPAESAVGSETPRTLESSIDFSTTCPLFVEQGSCPYGYKCRFLGGHRKKVVKGPDMTTDTLPLIDVNYTANPNANTKELNTVTTNLLKLLRSRKVRPLFPSPLS